MDREINSAYRCLEDFRDNLVSKFTTLCHYNDFNKLSLLKIVDTINNVYDKTVVGISEEPIIVYQIRSVRNPDTGIEELCVGRALFDRQLYTEFGKTVFLTKDDAYTALANWNRRAKE